MNDPVWTLASLKLHFDRVIADLNVEIDRRFDDSQRDRYSPAFDIGTNAGFRRLDFPGLRPTGVRESTTTLFYRADNCLGI